LPNWLIAVGGDPGVLLGQSTLVAPQLRSIAPTLTHFDAHPAIGWPLSGVDWLAAGSAALRFDPLCGDGTGNAVREAILACAVVKAACGGEDPEALAQHYRLRLLAGFRRHLEVCAQFYQTGGDGPWWTDQLTSLREGLAFCDEFLHKAEFRYRLNGLELEPVA
jgi:flavin-dependent dehydrogenase